MATWRRGFILSSVTTLYFVYVIAACSVQVRAGAGTVQLSMAAGARLFPPSKRRRRPISTVYRSSLGWRPAGRRSRAARSRTC